MSTFATARPHYDILVPGNYFCDIIFTGVPNFPQLGHEVYTDGMAVIPGGGALNTSLALHRLGLNPGWVGVLGNDFFSHFVRHFIQNEGLDMSLLKHIDKPLQRVTVAISFPTDRAFVTHVDGSPNSIELAFDVLERADFPHLHFTGLMIHERVPDLLQACHGRGITVSMDCQERIQTLDMTLVQHILADLDMFMPNASEAQKLTGTATLDDAIRVLTKHTRHLVIKNGAQGAISIREGQFFESPAMALDGAVVDTTGAGDVFNAGFLAAYLAGHSHDECLRWGNFCGGMSVRGHGGISTAPTKAQLDEWRLSQIRTSQITKLP
jgi:sugar/nucleoside kinase (ribokinase family)